MPTYQTTSLRMRQKFDRMRLQFRSGNRVTMKIRKNFGLVADLDQALRNGNMFVCKEIVMDHNRARRPGAWRTRIPNTYEYGVIDGKGRLYLLSQVAHAWVKNPAETAWISADIRIPIDQWGHGKLYYRCRTSEHWFNHLHELCALLVQEAVVVKDKQ